MFNDTHAFRRLIDNTDYVLFCHHYGFSTVRNSFFFSFTSQIYLFVQLAALLIQNDLMAIFAFELATSKILLGNQIEIEIRLW